jgi:hypothetical protein
MATRNETYDSNGNLLSVVDTRSIEQVKEVKRQEINAYREVKLDSGLWYLGYNWDTDERSRANITGMTAGMASGIPLPAGLTWRDSNNNNVPFNQTKLVTLAGYILLYVNQVYGASWAMKSVLENMETLEELDAFDVRTQSWPDGDMDGSRPD